MAPTAAYLHTLGNSVFPYINNWLLIAQSHTQALKDIALTLSLLADLGLKVNVTKSVLTTSQRVTYIGAVLDSHRGPISLENVQSRYILLSTTSSLMRSSQLIKYNASSATSVIQYAQLKMCLLQSWYLSLFNPLLNPPTMLLQVTPEHASQLIWWIISANLFLGRPFAPLQLTAQITTDASLVSWGAHRNNLQVHASWSPYAKGLHISNLELLVIQSVLCL